MPRGVHKNPFLGWNPPAEDSAWVRAFAEEHGVALSTLLNEALADLRAKHSAKHPAAAVVPRRARKSRADTAPDVVFVAAGQPQPQTTPSRAHALNCKCGMCKPPKENKR